MSHFRNMAGFYVDEETDFQPERKRNLFNILIVSAFFLLLCLFLFAFVTDLQSGITAETASVSVHQGKDTEMAENETSGTETEISAIEPVAPAEAAESLPEMEYKS